MMMMVMMMMKMMMMCSWAATAQPPKQFTTRKIKIKDPNMQDPSMHDLKLSKQNPKCRIPNFKNQDSQSSKIKMMVVMICIHICDDGVQEEIPQLRWWQWSHRRVTRTPEPGDVMMRVPSRRAHSKSARTCKRKMLPDDHPLVLHWKKKSRK